MKLYLFDHCPYCTKVRLIMGLKGLIAEEIFIANDDTDTPNTLVGQKVVPILQQDNGQAMCESMDIIHYLDEHFGQKILQQANQPELTTWLEQVRDPVYSLTMPRCVMLPFAEFKTESARQYFRHKKEQTWGNFDNLYQNTDKFLTTMNALLVQLNTILSINCLTTHIFSENDIHLFAVLRNLTMVKGIIFSEKILHYTQELAKLSHLSLFFDQAC